MGIKGFTLRLGSDLYTLGMPNTLASRITDDNEDRLNAPIDVLVLSIIEDGFFSCNKALARHNSTATSP